jgi:hypothetical protein
MGEQVEPLGADRLGTIQLSNGVFRSNRSGPEGEDREQSGCTGVAGWAHWDRQLNGMAGEQETGEKTGEFFP